MQTNVPQNDFNLVNLKMVCKRRNIRLYKIFKHTDSGWRTRFDLRIRLLAEWYFSYIVLAHKLVKESITLQITSRTKAAHITTSIFKFFFDFDKFFAIFRDFNWVKSIFELFQN